MTRISYDSQVRKATAQDYTGIVGADVKGSTRINCLSVVVRTMEQLAEKDLSNETAPTLILTVGMVVDSINDGTFKYWLLGGGKKMSGEEVNDTELELWARFAELYKELYMHVTFKDVASIRIPRNPKFAVSMEQRTLNDYIEKAWDRIKITAPEIEEGNDEAL